MTGRHAFILTGGVKIDWTGAQQDIAKWQGVMQKMKPITIKSQLPQAGDTGNAQQFLDDIKKQATAIESIIVKTKTMRNAQDDVKTGITQMTTVFRDKFGNLRTVTNQVTSEVTGLGREYKKVSEEITRSDPGRALRKVQAEIEATSAKYKTMGEKATEWSNRAENMGTRERTSIQAASTALKEKIALYDRAVQRGSARGIKTTSKEVEIANIELEKQIALSKRAATGIDSWTNSIGRAIKQTISYAFSLGLIRSAQQEVNKAIQFTIELNKEMIKIQVLQAEGAKTSEEINSVARSYNALAKEMGTTTVEVAKGSVEWLRQGKTAAETTELLRASTTLSKLGALESAEATEYLTSTVNSYGMAADEAMKVVDKLIAVDNQSATSSKELATALRYSASGAKEAGVSIEQLISYIGVISSTTRQNAESIGQAMKTIFTRMMDIKAGQIDEDGLGLNNVESALARVDIKLRENETTWRGMGDVLEDVAVKWNTLNDIEQANIAKAIAGKVYARACGNTC